MRVGRGVAQLGPPIGLSLQAREAGKSTTLRMLVGLAEPDEGAGRILGERNRDLPNPGRRVGILLDASAQHAGRRGREAFGLSARFMGLPAERVDEVPVLVGLDAAAAERRVGRYSLGMRQRRGFAERGGTVLLSSHLLAEVEAVADRMVIIGGGTVSGRRWATSG